MNEHKINSRIHIIKELVGGGVIIHADGREEYLDGQTPPTEKEIEDKKAELKAQYDAEEYARTRQSLYPDIGDQLDALYHAGVFPTDMAAKIKKVKDDNPKG